MRSSAAQRLALSDRALPLADLSNTMRIPSGFDLRALEVFSCVARERSMTVAAKQLELSQSTVSQIISQLEATLGVALFDRSVRPPALTKAGNTLHKQADSLLENAIATLRQTRESAGLSLPTLRIAMIDSFAAVVGPALVRTLHDEAQHWRVWSGLSPSHLDALNDHQVDFIIGDHQDDARLLKHLIVREPYLLALPRDDKGPHDTLAQVAARLPLVRYSLRSRIGQQVESHIEASGIKAPMALEFDTAPAQLAMIGAGLGWGLTTPLCALHARGELDKLQLLPMPGVALIREIFLISHRGQLNSLAERTATVARQLIEQELLPELHKRFENLDLTIS